jgi:anti-anti-sigma factor
MKANLRKDGDLTIIEIKGYLDYESAYPLKNSLQEIYSRDENSRIVFDLKGLEFVGSTGVSTFVKTLKVFNKMRMKPCYCNVKSEFLTLFKAYEEQEKPFTVIGNITQSIRSSLDSYLAAQAEIERSKATH